MKCVDFRCEGADPSLVSLSVHCPDSVSQKHRREQAGKGRCPLWKAGEGATLRSKAKFSVVGCGQGMEDTHMLIVFLLLH